MNLAGPVVIAHLASDAVDAGDETKAVLYYDLGFQLVGSLLVQIADNLVFFYVFRSVGTELSRAQTLLVAVAVMLTMYCSWTFQHFLFPFFLDTNSPGFQPIAYWTSVVYMVSTGVFDLSFSGYFIYLLVLDFLDIRRMSAVNRSFAIKFMIYFCFRLVSLSL